MKCNQINRHVYIYALCEPQQIWDVRYIGKVHGRDSKTMDQDLQNRLRCHIKDCRKKIRSYKTNWLRYLLAQGLTPSIKLIDITDDENWADIEKFYIRSYRAVGFRLTNTTDGGEGVIGLRHSTETKTKLSKASLGQTVSEETKQRIGLAHRGNQWAKGKKHSIAARQAKAERQTGHIVSPASRLKMASKVRPNNKSGYTGVYYDSKHYAWVAQISIDGKKHHLGYFNAITDAISARQRAVEQYYGTNKSAAERYEDRETVDGAPAIITMPRQTKLRPDNNSGYRGVSWDKRRKYWNANIQHNKTAIYIGHFDTAEEAARAWDATAWRLKGNRAKLNFPITPSPPTK